MAALAKEDLPVGKDQPYLNGSAKEPPVSLQANNGLLSEDKPKHSYDLPPLSLIDRSIDEPRPLRVAVIGGGLAGILAGVLLPAKVPGIDLTIIEKNRNFGGTWLENIYPGVRCDIPSHVYQSTFAPKMDWSDKFAPGEEIKDYWQSVAKKYDVYRYAKFGHRVEAATWNAAAGKWSLNMTNLHTACRITQEYDIVITAVGRFNDWKLPEYPGLSDYEGHLRHASNWDASFDPTGKTVAVIGNGASGIQIVANLQKTVAKLDHYARSKTWVATSWAGDERTLEAQPISQEEQDQCRDEEAYLNFRKKLEDKYWRGFDSFFRGTTENLELAASLTKVMERRLVDKPELVNRLVPDFSPNCRRLTPGPGYLEAITQNNVEYIQTAIRRFTRAGIETQDGKHRAVDAVICATGSRSDLLPPFQITAHNKTLNDLWKVDGYYGFPYTYFGVASPGFPNLLFLHGPHGTGPSGTVPHAVETQLTYFAKILRKVSREGIKSIDASKEAADDFIQYCDAFFASTVLSDGCSSWYNGGQPSGRIHGVWPGSAAHLSIVRREPRWEDFKYEYFGTTANRFMWYFGNGKTSKELDLASDMTSYLRQPDAVDLKHLHESWWDLP
ncbi:flavin-binding monooxygenase [Pochonia chlamydosporia 170]|uniref:Flavin-binding monooxygenase n=1 Tax=Pochonia chlamydosporia 170 TaxID=1380566 RepID=A0A179F845_METCM|nr:flavin-binding monooxygenase [Pochonia chlamydosporia 170]OAQ61269.1 flavin-binding monooxygenase [Pochonia chlamydosporia 170]